MDLVLLLDDLVVLVPTFLGEAVIEYHPTCEHWVLLYPGSGNWPPHHTATLAEAHIELERWLLAIISVRLEQKLLKTIH